METNLCHKVSCVVNYAYDASEPDELSVKPGDVIHDVERLTGGWWKGELRGRRGMFPDNFVTVLSDQNGTRSGGVQGRCRAVFSYQPANPDELPLYVGDVLDVLGEVEEGWWQGRRQGRVGVFPSNFVVMLEPTSTGFEPTSPAPALPPKPVKELCRVLFPYAAVNEDELTLSEGEVVTIVSKDAPDRGWWRGELNGRVGLFPDNFVQLLPVAQDVEEKKPERPPAKANSGIYPVLNKYTEKTASVKELTTTKISSHKENSLTKESSSQSTVTHTNKSESEKLIHSETTSETTVDGQVKKPPVPLKKSPTPTSGVGGLLSGLKSKMLSSSDKEKSSINVSSSSSSSGEWDRADGATASRPTTANTNVNLNTNTSSNTNTFDHVERNSILNDPRAGRVKAPRRRPPSQVFREDTVVVTHNIGLSNGHEAINSAEKPVAEKKEEIKPRAREWEKHKAPWMEELKLNQAKKTSLGDGKQHGSTERILECGLEEKRSTHSMEMSKSTSSISNRISILESFEEAKTRHSLDSKKDLSEPVHSPTAAGRTLLTMLDEVKKPPAPVPPVNEVNAQKPEKLPNKIEKTVTTSEKQSETLSKGDKTSTIERITQSTKTEEKVMERTGVLGDKSASTLERGLHTVKTEKNDGVNELITQLNNRITNLEKLLEVQNAKFNATIDELNTKLKVETEKRAALQAEVDKLAQCVTQV